MILTDWDRRAAFPCAAHKRIEGVRSMAKSRIVKMNEKIAEKATNAFSMIENTVVGEYSKIEDAFVDRYLTKESKSIFLHH